MAIQWSDKDISLEKIAEIEEILEYDIGVGHEVDGHDFGNGQANIFLLTINPQKLFEEIMGLLDKSELVGAKIAYRQENKNEFTILWPSDAKHFEIN